LAVDSSSIDVVKLLLDARVDKDTQQKDEAAALDIASRKGNDAIVKLLLDAGANKDAKDNFRWRGRRLIAAV
jgi:ankyrin repeat protein